MIPRGSIWLELRENYVSPLVEYKIIENKAEFWTSRYVLATRPLKVEFVDNEVFNLTFNREDIFKCLLCDIELALNRTTIQIAAAIRNSSVDSGVSSSWRFVTYYYLSFFSAYLFLKQIHSGFINIDSELSKELSVLFSNSIGDVIKVKQGCYRIDVNELDKKEAKVKISRKDGNIHENVWEIFCDNIKGILKNRPLNEETTYYQSYLKSRIQGGWLYPSLIRNLINYRLEYNYKEILNGEADSLLELKRVLTKDTYIKKLKDSSGGSSDNVQENKYWIALLGINLYFLTTELYLEYLLRSKSKYNFWLEKRKSFLKKNIDMTVAQINNWFETS